MRSAGYGYSNACNSALLAGTSPSQLRRVQSALGSPVMMVKLRAARVKSTASDPLGQRCALNDLVNGAPQPARLNDLLVFSEERGKGHRNGRASN